MWQINYFRTNNEWDKEKTDNIIYLNFEDEREFRAFNNIDNNSKKILITNDEIDYSTSVIEHIKLKNFLLMIKKTTKNRFKYLLVVFIWGCNFSFLLIITVNFFIFCIKLHKSPLLF